MLALGRLQDPSTVDTQVKGLNDADAYVRASAAFAIGLMGLSWQPLKEDVKAQLSRALLDADTDDQAERVTLALLDAMGRVGTPETMGRLVSHLTGPKVELRVRAATALGAAVKAVKATVPDRAFEVLPASLTKESAIELRFAVAYALAASKSALARPALAACLQDDAADVRAVCARGLIDVGTEADVTALRDLIDDPDYRVAVEAVRALAKMSLKCKPEGDCPSLSALDDLTPRVDRLLKGDSVNGAQPLLAFAQATLPSRAKLLIASLRARISTGFETASGPHAKPDSANIDCRLAAASDRLNKTLTESQTCGFKLVPEARRISLGLRELGHSGEIVDVEKRIAQVRPYLTHESAKVRQAALETISETKSPLVMAEVRSLLASDDQIVAATAAGAAVNLQDKEAIPGIIALASRVKPEAASTVASALAALDAKEAVPELQRWLGSRHLPVRLAAAEALTKLTGQTVVAPPFSGRAGRFVPPTADETKLSVKTAKGTFVVKLDVERAPVTTGNMVSLAKKKYFDHQTFHRIVPDFVAQGGDPRGDGEGGPGYTIPCEINARRYTRGSIGMALSGKDTGGSQWFVTTSAQPHLEGKYTAFGEVSSGQEVVDALLEDDEIIEVAVAAGE